ncbi:MAG: cell division protein ZapB [Bacteroidetes bacterium]|nr:cell division protein ZapB [Bacteroidota bacterium]
MKKLFFSASFIVALNISSYAQNVWGTTTIPTTTTTGAVGIGTSTPYVNLQVTGSNVGPDNLFNADDNSVFEGNNALVKLYGANLGGIDFSTYKPDVNGVPTFYRNYATFRYNFTNDQLVYQNHKIGQVFMFDADGNFGLGTTAPTAKLHVNGTFRLQGNGAINNYVLTCDANGNATWKAPAGVASDWIKNGNNISYSGGNVGIGTGADVPKTDLQIKGAEPFMTLTSTGTIEGQYGNQYNLGINFEGNDKYFIGRNFKAVANNYFMIRNLSKLQAAYISLKDDKILLGGSGATSVNNEGRVVVNTMSTNDNGISLAIKTTNTNDKGDISFESPTNRNDFVYLDFPNFTDKINSVLSVYKDANGKMALTFDDRTSGTADVKFKVAGDGIVYAHEIKVMAGAFPDYVFEKNYRLMPLAELDKFISENKHLPNINTAADVKENGLTLGEMQVKQMEKIEELSLYLIAINKRLQELEEQNKQLQSELIQIQNK